MTDGPGRSRATRRGFLALAGCAAASGCNALPDALGEDDDGDDPVTVDGDALREAVSGEVPTAPETVPVEIERAYLDETESRARDLLSSVPAPLGREDVPNGAMRAELSDDYEDATDALNAATDAETRFERMASLRSARQHARSVAAAWAAIDEGLTREAVREDAAPVRDALDDFRGRWRYVGEDPVRAVVVHATLESLVESAARRARRVADPSASRRPYETRETPISVGGVAADLERARAALDDAVHLYDRFTASLDDPRRLGSAFEAAGESLAETVEERRDDLPDGDRHEPSSLVDRDVGDTPVGSALGELYGYVDRAYRLEDARSSGRRASAVLAAHEVLVRVRAFESLRRRIEDGEDVSVESVDDVRRLREDAVEAVEAALESPDHPELTRRVVGDFAGTFDFVADRISDRAGREEVQIGWFERELGRYVAAAESAPATPPTSAEVVAELREAV